MSLTTFAQLQEVYTQPFFDLISQAHACHKKHWKDRTVQLCTLLNVKTGGCSEDCAYCSQSARYKTGIEREQLMTCQEIMPLARQAKENGSTRFCMGAAWRGVRAGEKKFDQMLESIREVGKLGMEVCVTLGNLGEEEARQLKEAGVTAYNHNIDTSPEHYSKIVSTHSFQNRLDTIAAVQKAGMSVCCGGILGMGESVEDRLKMLEVLCNLDPQPDSVPINSLMPMPGTPLAETPPLNIFDWVRMIATTRLALPKARVRLSAGRVLMSEEGQALAFYAGANSIFYGEKLLTAKNPEVNQDLGLLEKLDLKPLESMNLKPHHHEAAH